MSLCDRGRGHYQPPKLKMTMSTPQILDLGGSQRLCYDVLEKVKWGLGPTDTKVHMTSVEREQA